MDESIGPMKAYRLEDLRVGLAHSFDVSVTAQMVDQFAVLSGDMNPLHVDPSHARSLGHRDRVVHGMLTASFYSTLTGMYLPGRHALLQGVDVSFTAPVFPGDRLTVSGEITAIHAVVRQIEIKARVVNESGQTVSRAKIRSGIHE